VPTLHQIKGSWHRGCLNIPKHSHPHGAAYFKLDKCCRAAMRPDEKLADYRSHLEWF
jgi:hypothetical protein